MINLYEIMIGPGEIKKLKIIDQYSYHRLAYSLAPHVEEGRPVLFDVLEGEKNSKKLVLSTPFQIDRANLEGFEYLHKEILDGFFRHPRYYFRVSLNPVKRKERKEFPIIGREKQMAWFKAMSDTWGFSFDESQVALQVENALVFKAKDENKITANRVTFSGVLTVTDAELFKNKLQQGFGRRKAFGFGLMHLHPLV